jgi:predicted enzyme related to lactoylglutathione lyase
MITHVTVKTTKLKETVTFYQWLLNVPISKTLTTPMGAMVFLGNSQAFFEIIEDTNAKRIEAVGLSIGIPVDNLDEKIAMLDDREIAHSAIIAPSPDTRFVFFTDLNGCEIQLCDMK